MAGRQVPGSELAALRIKLLPNGARYALRVACEKRKVLAIECELCNFVSQIGVMRIKA